MSCMKKKLVGSLVLGMLVFGGCSYDERCDKTELTKLEYLWCPRLDSAIVEWMPKLDKLIPSHGNLADCERFESGYEPQHGLLLKCDNDYVTGKFILRLFAHAVSFRKDSGFVMLRVDMHVDSDHGVSRPFQDDVADLFLGIYGCTAYECKNAEKIHVYIREGVSIAYVLYGLPMEETRITYDQWLTPEHFKIIETNSNPPSSSEGYYMYHHFRLIVDSPSIKMIIETQCDSSCRNTWVTPDVSFPIGG